MCDAASPYHVHDVSCGQFCLSGVLFMHHPIQVKLLIVIIILSIIKTGFYAPLPPQNTHKKTRSHTKTTTKTTSSSLTMFRWCSPPPSRPPTGCSPPAVSPAGSSGTSLSSEFSLPSLQDRNYGCRDVEGHLHCLKPIVFVYSF